MGPDHTRTQSWSNRKLPTDAAVEAIEPLNKKDGWPWEYAIQLCNQADMDMWINIPVSVDDDYIRNLAALIKATLKPNLNIYLEHSNEVVELRLPPICLEQGPGQGRGPGRKRPI